MSNRPVPAAEAATRTFISLNELERLCRENPIDYLIEGLLPADDVHLAVGDSGLGKTPWAYQLGLCVAAGIPFLGHPTRQGRVLYVDLENGPEAVLNVAASLCRYLGIGPFPEDFLVRREEVAVPDLGVVIPEYRPRLAIVDTLRAFKPSAETQNEDAGKLLNYLRAIARQEHCAILLLHHLRKPGEFGQQALEDKPALEWLLSANGARAIVNQTNARIALDTQRRFSTREAALVMKCFIKIKGEVGPIYLERICDDDGDPLGYRRMVGPDLLGHYEQEEAYRRLPQEFTFRQAVEVYGKTDDPTRKFLNKCKAIGILEQPGKGLYRKLPIGESIERVEGQPTIFDVRLTPRDIQEMISGNQGGF